MILTATQRQTLFALAGVVPRREGMHDVPALVRRGLAGTDGTLTAAGQDVVDRWLADRRADEARRMRDYVREHRKRFRGRPE